MSPLMLRGQSDVMRWCGGVTRAAVSNWLARYPGSVPEPDAIIANEGTDQVTRGWTLDRKDEWMAFAAARLTHPGGGAVLSARRRTADLIRRQASTGQIPGSVAIELLASLIGSEPTEENETGGTS